MSSNQIGFYNTKSTLFVSNIDTAITEHELANLFSPFGPIHSTKLIQNESNKCAYIKFFDSKHAVSAKEKTQYTRLGQQNIRISFKKDEKDILSEGVLLIENLPKGCTPQAIKQYFIEAGAPEPYIRLDNSKEGKIFGRGRAMFATDDEARMALITVEGKKFEGKELKLKYLGQNDVNTSIYIKTVHHEKRTQEIKSFFTEVLSEYGELSRRIVGRRSRKQNEVYKVVAVFKEHDDAEAAICDIKKNPEKYFDANFPAIVVDVGWHINTWILPASPLPKAKKEKNKQKSPMKIDGRLEANRLVNENKIESACSQNQDVSESKNISKPDITISPQKESGQTEQSKENCFKILSQDESGVSTVGLCLDSEEIKSNEEESKELELSSKSAISDKLIFDVSSIPYVKEITLTEESKEIGSNTENSDYQESFYSFDLSLKSIGSDQSSSLGSQAISSITISSRTPNSLYQYSKVTSISTLTVNSGLELVVRASKNNLCKSQDEEEYVQKAIMKFLANGDQIEHVAFRKQSDNNGYVIAIRYTEGKNNPFGKDLSKPLRVEAEDGRDYFVNEISKEAYDQLSKGKTELKGPSPPSKIIVSDPKQVNKNGAKTKSQKKKKPTKRQRKKRRNNDNEVHLIYHRKGEAKETVLDRSTGMQEFENFDEKKKRQVLKQSLSGLIKDDVDFEYASQVIEMLIDSVINKPKEIKKLIGDEKYRKDKCKEMLKIIKETGLIAKTSQKSKQKKQETLLLVKKTIFERMIGIELNKFLRFDLQIREQTLQEFLLPRVSNLTNNIIAPRIVNILIGISRQTDNELRSIVENGEYLKEKVQRLFKFFESRKNKEPNALVFRPKRQRNRAKNAGKMQINNMNDGLAYMANLNIANFFMYYQIFMYNVGWYNPHGFYPGYQDMTEYQYANSEITESVPMVNQEVIEPNPVVVESRQVEEKEEEKESLKIQVKEDHKEDVRPSQRKKNRRKENRNYDKLNPLHKKEESSEDRETKNSKIETPIKEGQITTSVDDRDIRYSPTKRPINDRKEDEIFTKQGPVENKNKKNNKIKKFDKEDHKEDKIHHSSPKKKSDENTEINNYKIKTPIKKYPKGVKLYFIKKEPLEDRNTQNEEIKIPIQEESKGDEAYLSSLDQKQESADDRADKHFKKRLSILNGYSLDRRAGILGEPLLPRIVAITNPNQGLEVFKKFKERGGLKSVENVMDLLDNQDLLKKQVEAILKEIKM